MRSSRISVMSIFLALVLIIIFTPVSANQLSEIDKTKDQIKLITEENTCLLYDARDNDKFRIDIDQSSFSLYKSIFEELGIPYSGIVGKGEFELHDRSIDEDTAFDEDEGFNRSVYIYRKYDTWNVLESESDFSDHEKSISRDYLIVSDNQKFEAFVRDTDIRLFESLSLRSSYVITQTIRKSKSYWSYFNEGGVNVYRLAGSYIVDYVIKKYADTDPNYDYIFVHRLEQITPHHETISWVTNRYASGMGQYYAGDDILSWTPNTGGLNLNNNNSYSFSLSIPFSVPLGFTWQGSSSVNMTGIGDKSTGFYLNEFNKLTAVSYANFTVENGCFFKMPATSTSRVQYKHSFRDAIYGNGSDPKYFGEIWYYIQINY